MKGGDRENHEVCFWLVPGGLEGLLFPPGKSDKVLDLDTLHTPSAAHTSTAHTVNCTHVNCTHVNCTHVNCTHRQLPSAAHTTVLETVVGIFRFESRTRLNTVRLERKLYRQQLIYSRLRNIISVLIRNSAVTITSCPLPSAPLGRNRADQRGRQDFCSEQMSSNDQKKPP